jgi:hypothetical protein
MMEHLPSLFDSIRAHSNCICSTCWLMWDLIDHELMAGRDWEFYSMHLQQSHG